MSIITVTIDGPVGSGKTTIAGIIHAALAEAYQPEPVTVLYLGPESSEAGIQQAIAGHERVIIIRDEPPRPAQPLAAGLLDAQAFAARITGRAYGEELTRDEIAHAKAAGLVVVYGASDDLMEFEGAIHDEVSCYGGGTALVDREGLLDRDQIDDSDDEAIADYVSRKSGARQIEALWAKEDGYSWTYQTDIPHATFEIVEDGEPYCRGIVFALADVGGAA